MFSVIKNKKFIITSRIEILFKRKDNLKTEKLKKEIETQKEIFFMQKHTLKYFKYFMQLSQKQAFSENYFHFLRLFRF